MRFTAGAAWMLAAQASFLPSAALAADANPQAEPVLAPTGGADKVLVSRFLVTGVTVFSLDPLWTLLADAEGRELTLGQIALLAQRITAFYRAHGYILARAYVPEQDIRDGVVEIRVLEGRIGRIDVNGARNYTADSLRSYLVRGPRAPVFHAGRYEQGLLLLNDLPGLQVKSALKPGAELGTTDVVLDVEKDRFVTGGLDVNNHGSRATGRERLGVAVNLNNPLGWGDVLALRGLTSRTGDLWFARIGYSAALSTRGTRLGTAYTHIEVDTDVRGLSGDIDVRGAGDVGSVYLVHPFLRSRELSVYGQAGFDYKNFSNALRSRDQGGISGEDHLRVFTAGGALTSVDRWRGVSSASLTLHQGVGGFLGGLSADDDPDASRPGAGGTFTKLTGELSRLQQIAGPTAVFLRAAGQWASRGLVSPEQFIVGGVGTVRGYPVAEVAGDHGYAGSIELRLNAPGFSDRPAFAGKKWGDVLQLSIFVDHGGGYLIDPLPDERRFRSLNGAGVGVQLNIPDKFLAKIEFARPIGPRPSDGLDNVIYFLTAVGF